jgi:hypothetical protein
MVRIPVIIMRLFDSKCSKPKNITDNLARLSAKPGVQYTLILSRKDGAIVQSTGLPTAEEQGEPLPDQKDASQSFDRPAGASQETAGEQQNANGQASAKTAENIARLVFAFVTASGELADALETANEVQLLRLRTGKGEVVIVPGKRLCGVSSDPADPIRCQIPPSRGARPTKDWVVSSTLRSIHRLHKMRSRYPALVALLI